MRWFALAAMLVNLSLSAAKSMWGVRVLGFATPFQFQKRANVPKRFSSTSTSESKSAVAEKGHGHGHGHMAGKIDENSFVQTELRKEAMRLHTRDQVRFRILRPCAIQTFILLFQLDVIWRYSHAI